MIAMVDGHTAVCRVIGDRAATVTERGDTRIVQFGR